MNYLTTHEEVRGVRAERERVAASLARYPNVSRHETSEILHFLRTGRHLDVGLLTSSEQLRPNLDAFMRDHQRHFGVSWREGVLVVGAILALLLLLALAWGAFA